MFDRRQRQRARANEFPGGLNRVPVVSHQVKQLRQYGFGAQQRKAHLLKSIYTHLMPSIRSVQEGEDGASVD